MKFSIKKIILLLVALVLLFALAVFCYFLIGVPKHMDNIKWGINFSQKQAELLGLDWKRTYIALLYDLNAKDIRIGADWDIIEPEKGKYSFDDLDWQINEAQKRGAEIILAMGIKTPRWPECHIPGWAKDFSVSENQQKVLDLIKEIIIRYKDNSSIWAWQVENEPFFNFGECPKIDDSFVKREIELVKSLDNRPVIVSESGEMSLWWKAGKLADIVGITMYKKVYSKEVRMYFDLPYPPIFYWRKTQLVKALFGKNVVCVELQAEPWASKVLYAAPLEEQLKVMNIDQFNKDVEFARSSGLDTFYLWGAEWWYWMKEKNNQPEYWDRAKALFNE